MIKRSMIKINFTNITNVNRNLLKIDKGIQVKFNIQPINMQLI